MKNFILAFLFHIILNSSLPSYDIWEKTLQYKNQNKMSFSNNRFIFDEENYTSLDIYDDKMKQIYNMQDKIYNNYHISTFIFAAKYIDDSKESFGSVRNNTRDNLRNNKYDVDNSIFTVISVTSNKALIYTGKNTRKNYISDTNAQSMKEKLLNNTKNKNYYNAWKDFIEDVNYYCEKNKVNSQTSFGEKVESFFHIYIIIFLGILLPIGFIICIIIICCKYKKRNTGKISIETNSTYYSNQSNPNIGNYSAGGYSGGGYSGGGYNCVGGQIVSSGGAN